VVHQYGTTTALRSWDYHSFLCASTAIQYAAQAERAQAVIDTFKLSWAGYYKYAFPNDELKPVTNGFGNSRYATIWRFSYYINLTNLEKQMGRISR
jgi:hypothetical protein